MVDEPVVSSSSTAAADALRFLLLAPEPDAARDSNAAGRRLRDVAEGATYDLAWVGASRSSSWSAATPLRWPVGADVRLAAGGGRAAVVDGNGDDVWRCGVGTAGMNRAGGAIEGEKTASGGAAAGVGGASADVGREAAAVAAGVDDGGSVRAGLTGRWASDASSAANAALDSSACCACCCCVLDGGKSGASPNSEGPLKSKSNESSAAKSLERGGSGDGGAGGGQPWLVLCQREGAGRKADARAVVNNTSLLAGVAKERLGGPLWRGRERRQGRVVEVGRRVLEKGKVVGVLAVGSGGELVEQRRGRLLLAGERVGGGRRTGSAGGGVGLVGERLKAERLILEEHDVVGCGRLGEQAVEVERV